MTLSNQIPTQDPVTDDKGKARFSWVEFFSGLVTGDNGTRWTPNSSGLTTVGTPTITGGYYTNQGFTDFWIYIAPATSTTSVSGTTYFDLPFTVSVDALCASITGSNSATGVVNASTKRCYPPSWVAITTPITLTGRVVSQ